MSPIDLFRRTGGPARAASHTLRPATEAGHSSTQQGRAQDRDDSVSVVIPFFNSADTIERALCSVAAQTVAVDEVIIVDDDSENEQRKSLATAAGRDHPMPVRVVRLEPNQGPAAARNAGWDAARSTWIAFLDSDDSWHPRRLELQLGALSAETLMISSQSLVLGADEHPPGSTALIEPPIRRLDKRYHLFHNPHTTSSVLVRRDVPARFTDGRFYAEDYEAWIRIAALGEVLTLQVPLAYFHKDPYGTRGLSSRIWRMILGEHRTFVLLRQDGVISVPQFLIAELIMAARIGRRLALRALRP